MGDFPWIFFLFEFVPLSIKCRTTSAFILGAITQRHKGVFPNASTLSTSTPLSKRIFQLIISDLLLQNEVGSIFVLYLASSGRHL